MTASRAPVVVSYLGPNTVPIAHDLSERLSRDLGREIGHIAPDSWTDVRRAMRDGSGWLFWMCGLVTVELVDEGRSGTEIVAAPIFPGESGPVYRSVVVTRSDSDLRSLDALAGSSLAVNAASSWSGYHALRAELAEMGRFDRFFTSVVVTGSHVGSIEAVLRGQADCAAIDSSIWADLANTRTDLGGLQVAAVTRDWPAPPFTVSTSLPTDVREAIVASLTREAPFGLEGIVPVVSGAYDPIRTGMAAAAPVDW